MHGSGPEEVGPPGPRMEASYPPAEGAETAVRTQGRAMDKEEVAGCPPKKRMCHHRW